MRHSWCKGRPKHLSIAVAQQKNQNQARRVCQVKSNLSPHQGHSHRKDWIEARLRELVDLFALDCAGFAIMDNHLHLLLRLDSQRAQNWSNEEVARRWLTNFPVRDVAGKALPISPI